MNQLETCGECGGDGRVSISCCGTNVKGTGWERMGVCPICAQPFEVEREECSICEGAGLIEIPRYTSSIGSDKILIEWEVAEEEYTFEAFLIRNELVKDHGFFLNLKASIYGKSQMLGLFKISEDYELEININTPTSYFTYEFKSLEILDDITEKMLISAFFDLLKVIDLTKLPTIFVNNDYSK